MLSFTYTLGRHGWSEARIANEGVSFSVRVSYLSDALRDLTAAVIALLRGASHASCAWQGEEARREYRWLFDRHNGEVHIAIVEFDTLFSRKADDQGAVVFATECPRRRLAGQVLNALWNLHTALGPAAYKERWGLHEFPLAEYKTLEELIRHETTKDDH
jgi:hypothetical protein